jgi:NIMA (never in mitosis gene a)-related kinase
MLGEITVMQKMNNPYIVKYFDSFLEDDQKVNIIMEFCEKGDLHKLLKKRKDLSSKQKHNLLSENLVWNFFI